MKARVDTGPLIAGFAIVATGALLLAREEGAVALEGWWLAAALLAATCVVLVASASGARGSWRISIGIALLALSLLLVLRELGIWWSDALIWPVVLAAFGVALLWRLTRPAAVDAAEPPTDAAGATPTRRRDARRASLTGFGVALVLGAALLFLWANGALAGAGNVALAALVLALALALVLAPLWWRLARNLAAERAERIRSQERAEMGAHLHDSVLQTLTLMRQRSADPADVERLARRQERELRACSPATASPGPDERLADALTPPPSRSRTHTERRSRRSSSATAPSTSGPRPLSPPPARRSPTRPSSPPKAARSASTPKSRRTACAPSSMTEARASTRRKCRRIAAACANRSSGEWSATVATPRSEASPAPGPRSS